MLLEWSVRLDWVRSSMLLFLEERKDGSVSEVSLFWSSLFSCRHVVFKYASRERSVVTRRRRKTCVRNTTTTPQRLLNRNLSHSCPRARTLRRNFVAY